MFTAPIMVLATALATQTKKSRLNFNPRLALTQPLKKWTLSSNYTRCWGGGGGGGCDIGWWNDNVD